MRLGRRAVLAVALLAGGCSNCSKKSATPANDAGPTATADAGAPAPPDAWWLSLPDLPEGSPDLAVSVIHLEGPDERRWGWAASALCGETDFFLFDTPLLSTHLAEGLLCGRTLLAHASGDALYSIDFDRQSHLHPSPFYALPLRAQTLDDVEKLLSDFHREKAGGVELLCRTFDPSPKSCESRNDPEDHAAALVDGYLVSGGYLAIAQFLKSPLRTWTLAQLRRTSEFFTDAQLTVDFDLQPKGTRWTIGPRRWLNYSREESEPFSAAVRQHARAVAWESAWEAGRGAITLVPRCSDRSCPERALLEGAFRTYHTLWSDTAQLRLAQLYDDESAGADGTCERAHESAMVDAMKRAEVHVTALGAIELRYAIAAQTMRELAPARAKCDQLRREADQLPIARVRALLSE